MIIENYVNGNRCIHGVQPFVFSGQGERGHGIFLDQGSRKCAFPAGCGFRHVNKLKNRCPGKLPHELQPVRHIMGPAHSNLLMCGFEKKIIMDDQIFERVYSAQESN